jgi:hypothetical protein
VTGASSEPGSDASTPPSLHLSYCKPVVSAPSLRAESFAKLLAIDRVSEFGDHGGRVAGRSSHRLVCCSLPISNLLSFLFSPLLPRFPLIPLPLPRTRLEPPHSVSSHGCLQHLMQGNANNQALTYLNTPFFALASLEHSTRLS